MKLLLKKKPLMASEIIKKLLLFNFPHAGVLNKNSSFKIGFKHLNLE